MMKKHDHDHNHSHNHNHNHDHDHSHGHSHRHFHSHHGSNHAPHVIKKAIVVTVLFMVVELLGGWYANSLALISDGFHMLTDVGAMSLSLFALWIAQRPSTSTMSFGYHRAEVLGALLSGLFIWFIAGLLIYEAIVRLTEPPAVNGPVMLVIAIIGLLANIVSMWMLHSAKDDNINVRAAYLHMVSDSLGSISAIIAGVILIYTGWRPIDPIVTVIFSGLMLFSSWGLVKETVAVLMESTPTHVDPTKLKDELQAFTGVREVHDLHIWSVTTGKLALSVHLITEETETILQRANQFLQEKYGILHTTIQVEHPSRFQSERCYDCVPR